MTNNTLSQMYLSNALIEQRHRSNEMESPKTPIEVLRQRAQQANDEATRHGLEIVHLFGEIDRARVWEKDAVDRAKSFESAAKALEKAAEDTANCAGQVQPSDSACGGGSGKAARVFDERYKILLNGHKVIRLTRGSSGVVVRAWCTGSGEYTYSVDSTGQYMAGNRAYDVRRANGNLLNEKDGF